MPRILTKLKINEVSHVDRGAGEGVKVVMMKRDAPPQGSVREKFLFQIEQLRRGFPDMPVRQARAEAWNALSDDEQVEILREERQMNKLDNSTLFDDWWRQLDASERRRYRSQQAEIDRELAEAGTGGDGTSGRGGSQFNGRPTSPAIEPAGTPRAPVFEKKDHALSLKSIVKRYGIAPLAKMICDENDAHGITEAEFIQFVGEYAATKGQSLGVLLSATNGEGAMLTKAAAICRYAAHARQAQENLLAARMRQRG
jgi:hypothetical protein